MSIQIINNHQNHHSGSFHYRLDHQFTDTLGNIVNIICAIHKRNWWVHTFGNYDEVINNYTDV